MSTSSGTTSILKITSHLRSFFNLTHYDNIPKISHALVRLSRVALLLLGITKFQPAVVTEVSPGCEMMTDSNFSHNQVFSQLSIS